MAFIRSVQELRILSFTSSFTPVLACRAWFIMSSILRTASSMAADVVAISLSTMAPSSSCRTSRLLGFSSWPS